MREVSSFPASHYKRYVGAAITRETDCAAANYTKAMATQRFDSIVQRMRLTLDLYELGESMFRQRLRRQHPEASDDEIEATIQEWRTRRRGAESGDAPGPERPWPPA